MTTAPQVAYAISQIPRADMIASIKERVSKDKEIDLTDKGIYLPRGWSGKWVNHQVCNISTDGVTDCPTADYANWRDYPKRGLDEYSDEVIAMIYLSLK